ncbi:sentrin-specific protease 1-like [Nilaparvata lugens]|uniref:sentrin-specific protease 1-like n=1 Tax=Nilaparvata lugens TaxID=108931 RepID=UPI00193E62AC|nr:sentrin-specific protease 1-like [Nilaparvata lugens]
MNLLIERSKKEGLPKVYAFNTFFYPKLMESGHASLKRWTRKIDIFSQDLIIVPVHLDMHWCMAIMDFRSKRVEYYDSMGSHNNKCLTALLKYLEEESKDKKKTPYDTSDWKAVNMEDIPQQTNGSDCGMFACMFAEYKCRNAKITFSQKEMPYFRQKMEKEILTGKLMM